MVFLLDGKSIFSMRLFIIVFFVCVDLRFQLGILFSYSVFQQLQDIIVLLFIEFEIFLEIKDKVIKMSFRLLDDCWYYVGVVWNGIIGDIFVYVDGLEREYFKDVNIGSIIMGGGWIVLGQ